MGIVRRRSNLMYVEVAKHLTIPPQNTTIINEIALFAYGIVVSSRANIVNIIYARRR